MASDQTDRFDGDPAVVAILLLGRHGADELRARIQRDCAGGLGNGEPDLHRWVKAAAPSAYLRHTLATRLAILDGTDPPAGGPEEMLYEAARRRWPDAVAIERGRSSLVSQLNQELIHLESRIGSHGAVYGERNTPAARLGLIRPQDEWLARTEPQLRRRAQLKAWIASLQDGGGARTERVRAAMDAAGGRDEIVAAIAPGMPVTDRSGEGSDRLAVIDAELRRLPADTPRAAALTAEAEAIGSRLAGAAKRADADRLDLANRLFIAALSGDLAAIEELRRRATDTLPALADALVDAVHHASHLATVGILYAEAIEAIQAGK